jgi:DNA polymerase I-like protein with 3'-5' exonuclease and polymerase domains
MRGEGSRGLGGPGEEGRKMKIVQKISELPVFGNRTTLVIDVETSGVIPALGARICGIGIGELTGERYYIPIRHRNYSGEEIFNSKRTKLLNFVLHGEDTLFKMPPEYVNLSEADVFTWLKTLLLNKNIRWVAHNAKFEMQMLWAEGLDFAGLVWCTMAIAHQASGHRHNFSLDYLTSKILPGFKHVWYDKIVQYKKKYKIKDYSMIPIKLLGPYCCEDVDATAKLFSFFERDVGPMTSALRTSSAPVAADLSAWSGPKLLRNEQKLVRVLGKMEYRGIPVDRRLADTLFERAEDEQERQVRIISEITGKSFRPTKWQRFAEELGKIDSVKFWMLPDEEKGKQKGQQYTTNKEHSTGKPCFNAAARLEYLKMYKDKPSSSAYNLMLALHKFSNSLFLQSNFLGKILKFTDSKDRLHSGFNQTGTVTGRLSSSKIEDVGLNLQNQPKESGTQDQEAMEEELELDEDEIKSAINRLIRSCYVPSCADNVLVIMDYESLEYKLASFYSRDERLLRAYRSNPHLDFHKDTADILGVSRKVAKTINFGILYGMGRPALASKLISIGYRCTPNEAGNYISKIFEARPGLRDLIRTISSQAERLGCVQNIFGRVVHVDKEKSYKALNLLVQGTGGDMMRRCLVELDDFITAEKLSVEMLSSIHDELLFEMPRRCVKEYSPLLKTAMELHPEIDIPITVKVEIGEKNQANKIAYEDWVLSN